MTPAPAVPALRLPLLAPRDLQAPLAWIDGRPVSAAAFLADVVRQSAALPAGGAVVNLTPDRYRFAVGLAAALERGLMSLFPPNALPETIARLAETWPTLIALADSPAQAAGLPFVAADDTGDPAPAGMDAALPRIDASLPAACLLTSGSTGRPQPHVKTWGALVRNVDAAAHRLADLLGRPTLQGLAIVATVPAQHSYGFESSVLLGLLGGATFHGGRPFFPADIAAALAEVPRPRALVTTPFHLRTLLLSDIALPPVDLVLSATAPLSPQLARQCETRLGGLVVEIYGCTEAGQIASRQTARTDVWQTFGELRLEADPAADAAGSHRVRGGHVDTPTPLSDVIELVDDRHFRLLGRSNDVIHVAGKRSSLGHLNHHLNSVPGVEDGAFFLPEAQADRVVRPIAFVVAPTLSDAAILAGLRSRIESPFLPRRLVRVTALPREATGKLTEQRLRELAQAHDDAASASGHLVVPRCFAADHPAFAGHFPGQPVVPGALLLAEVMAAACTRAAPARRFAAGSTLASAKFLAPVGPGMPLKITIDWDDAGLRFEVTAPGGPAARGQWRWEDAS